MWKHMWLIGAALLLATTAAAGDKKPATEAGILALRTDYLLHRVCIVDGSLCAHTINLRVALDGKSGKGSLGVDPNIQRFDAFGDDAGNTEIATRSVDVTLVAVDRDDSTKKGRRLYEIKG